VLVSEFTPEAYASAWQSALSAHPDGIFFIGMFPNTTIQAQLQLPRGKLTNRAHRPGPEKYSFADNQLHFA